MKLFQSSIFRAVCAIIVGVLILKFPQDGVTWLTMAIGVLFLLSGIIALLAYWQARRHAGEYTITDQKGRIISGSQPTFPIVGVGSVILGLVLTLTPAAFVNGLMYVIGAVLILGAITQLTGLVAARRLGSVPFVFWICPSLVMLIGLYVMVNPHESAELPLIILGWCSLLYGLTEVINSLKIWSIQKEADKHVQQASLAEAEEISSHVGDDTLDVGLEDVDTRPVVPSPGND